MQMPARLFATICAAATIHCGAVTYQWTDITPSFSGNSDRGYSQVVDVGAHPLEGDRLVVLGGFWPLGQGTALTYQALYSDDGGRSWHPPQTEIPLAFPPLGSLVVDVARPGVVYALQASRLQSYGVFAGPSSTGALYRSEDFGRTWAAIYTIPVGQTVAPYAADPLDARGLYGFYQETYHDFGGVGFPVESRNWGITRSFDDGVHWSTPLAFPLRPRTLVMPTPSAPRRLFMGTFAQGSFVSPDAGATWTRADSGSAFPMRWIYPDPLHVNVWYAHRYEGEGRYVLLRSEDSGATWRQIFLSPSTEPNLAIDPAHPNVLWMPYKTDAIYRSGDRGETWQEVPYPQQDLPPNYDPGAWLIPAPSRPGSVYLVRFGRLYRGEPVARFAPLVAEYEYEGDRYWSTSLDGEAVFQDNRQQPGNVHRTGLRWGAWSADNAPAGAVGSCRFWPKPQSGLRTRVLVLQGPECESLRANNDWILEGENEFYAVPPANGACPAGLVPVHRLPNMKADLNFRWAVDPAVIAQMQARGWMDEGVVMCARPLGSNE